MMENFIANAAGSLRQARTQVIQQVQQIKITTANYEDVAELLALCSRLADLQAKLEVIGNRYGEVQTNGTPVRVGNGARAARA
jgi:ABC-type uncharacterized transport system fused permease/ATPase subunit